MHIVNAMFGCGLGGIEQAFVDYCQAITAQGHRVTAVLHPDSRIRLQVEAVAGVELRYIRNFGAWDMLARCRLAKLMKELQADAAILHGNRAVQLMRKGAEAAGCKTVGVTHNYSLARQIGLDGFFATTEDLRGELLRLGQPAESIHAIPNMIRLQDINPKPHVRDEAVPVIGAMGRFVHKKGFAVFLDALAELRERGVVFSARLGGGGEELGALEEQASDRGLDGVLEFTGWVQDKAEFFGSIDVFCLPSLHEPFGIILLEAFAYHVPVVTADAEGPSEIATDGVDALVVAKQNAHALADALQRLLEEPALADRLVEAAAETVQAYDLDAVGQRICTALERIIARKG